MSDVTLEISLPISNVNILGQEPDQPEPQINVEELIAEERAKFQAEFDAKAAEFQATTQQQIAQLQATQNALAQAIAELNDYRQQSTAALKEQSTRLGLAVASKVLAAKIEAGDIDIDPIIADALKQAPQSETLTVRLHPEDFKNSKLAADENSYVNFVADIKTPQGGCRIETSCGTVESSVESSMNKIESTLTEDFAE